MRKELEHFYIGNSYGGNQDWFRTFMMRIGGCGAETACDSSLYFVLHKGVENAYSFDAGHLTKTDYVDFAHMMEKYLWPRMTGIYKLDMYIDSYGKYLEDSGVDCVRMRGFSGDEPYEAAAETLARQIDAGWPVPALVLNHRERAFKDYVWHWFLINGYDMNEGGGAADGSDAGRYSGMLVKAVTYSGWQWLDFEKLWDTGHESKGGLVLYDIER